MANKDEEMCLYIDEEAVLTIDYNSDEAAMEDNTVETIPIAGDKEHVKSVHEAENLLQNSAVSSNENGENIVETDAFSTRKEGTAIIGDDRVIEDEPQGGTNIVRNDDDVTLPVKDEDFSIDFTADVTMPADFAVGNTMKIQDAAISLDKHDESDDVILLHMDSSVELIDLDGYETDRHRNKLESKCTVTTTDGSDSQTDLESTFNVTATDGNDSPTGLSSDVPGQAESRETKEVVKNWIAIIENEPSDRIMDELEKLNKLYCLRRRNKEIHEVHQANRLRMFPILPEDLNNPIILDAMKNSTNAKFQILAGGPMNTERKGYLEFSFPNRIILKDYQQKLLNFSSCVQVMTDVKAPEFRIHLHEALGLPANFDKSDDLKLFMPSLPQSITAQDLAEYFPQARDIVLIPVQPRQHAYLEFDDEESLTRSVENLNDRGPQKEDFKFCRLLRLGTLMKRIWKPTANEAGVRGIQKGKMKQEASVSSKMPIPAQSMSTNETVPQVKALPVSQSINPPPNNAKKPRGMKQPTGAAAQTLSTPLVGTKRERRIEKQKRKRQRLLERAKLAAEGTVGVGAALPSSILGVGASQTSSVSPVNSQQNKTAVKSKPPARPFWQPQLPAQKLTQTLKQSLVKSQVPNQELQKKKRKQKKPKNLRQSNWRPFEDASLRLGSNYNQFRPPNLQPAQSHIDQDQTQVGLKVLHNFLSSLGQLRHQMGNSAAPVDNMPQGSSSTYTGTGDFSRNPASSNYGHVPFAGQKRPGPPISKKKNKKKRANLHGETSGFIGYLQSKNSNPDTQGYQGNFSSDYHSNQGNTYRDSSYGNNVPDFHKNPYYNEQDQSMQNRFHGDSTNVSGMQGVDFENKSEYPVPDLSQSGYYGNSSSYYRGRDQSSTYFSGCQKSADKAWCPDSTDTAHNYGRSQESLPARDQWRTQQYGFGSDTDFRY